MNFDKERPKLIRLLPKRFRKSTKYIYYDWILYLLYSLKYLLYYGRKEFFDSIAIETTTYCNLRCKNCPNSVHDRGNLKNKKQISLSLFRKIMHELGEINYHGEILFHFYGEPLTDERLPELVRYAKKIVPHAELQINTNGFLLTIEKYNLLANAGVKRFFITQYGKDMPQNIKNLLGYLKKNNKSSKNILYRILGEDLGLSNRGGELKVKNVVDFDRPICNYPNTAIQIDYAGNLVLCCNDYHSSIKLGNLNNQKLLEILNSHAYKKLRKEIRNGIYNLQICRKCVGLTKN